MATVKSKELQVKQKGEVAAPVEQTTPGPVFTPAVDICETEKENQVRLQAPVFPAIGLMSRLLPIRKPSNPDAKNICSFGVILKLFKMSCAGLFGTA